MCCFDATTTPRQVRKRDVMKSPALENCTAGSERGALGNGRPYLDLGRAFGVVVAINMALLAELGQSPKPHVGAPEHLGAPAGGQRKLPGALNEGGAALDPRQPLH